MANYKNTPGVYPESLRKYYDKHRKPLPMRFWDKVDRSGDCWTWTATKNSHGYGQIGIEGRLHIASRVAWEMENRRRLVRGQQVLHRCDNPACVRPAHLFIGTAVDNMQDCVRKGRFKFCEPRRGIQNNKAKLNEAGVIEVRRRYDAGETLSSLSRGFGMARATLRRIVRREGWRHVA